MWTDPIVAEVRRARLEIEKECDDDFARIYSRAIEVQKNAPFAEAGYFERQYQP